MRKSKTQKIIEEHGFNVKKMPDGGYSISQYTPAGEDWNMYVAKLEEICEYADEFDPEEEFNIWMCARINGDKSVPPPSKLWEDQEWKQNKLKEVAEEVRCLI